MKEVKILIVLDCRDDVPAHAIDWMAGNLAEHAENEFCGDYDPEFCEGYAGPPLEGGVEAGVVQIVPAPPEKQRLLGLFKEQFEQEFGRRHDEDEKGRA